MNRKIVISALCLIGMSVVGVTSVIASQKDGFFSSWGTYLNKVGEEYGKEGVYYTIAKEYACEEDETIDRDEIYAVGEESLLTKKEIDQAKEFYILSGYSQEESEKLSAEYMKKYEAIYLESVKKGFSATEDDINKKIEELKSFFETVEEADVLKETMNAFDSEEAYWAYEYQVYKKSLPIEKYREELEKEFRESLREETDSEQVQNKWLQWYEDFQEELANAQGYRVIDEISSEELEKDLKVFETSK